MATPNFLVIGTGSSQYAVAKDSATDAMFSGLKNALDDAIVTVGAVSSTASGLTSDDGSEVTITSAGQQYGASALDNTTLTSIGAVASYFVSVGVAAAAPLSVATSLSALGNNVMAVTAALMAATQAIIPATGSLTTAPASTMGAGLKVAVGLFVAYGMYEAFVA